MAYIKSSGRKDAKTRRVPNAFMIFVKEKSQELLKKCSDEEKASMGAYLGRKWKSMPVEEKQVYFEKYKALKALEDNELDSNPNKVDDTSSDEVNMKFKNGLTPSSVKQKLSKKVRRPPNAFMIFAREHRNTLDASLKKDKKEHTSTILGNMWRELGESEKEKYVAEARRLFNVHKMSEPASFHKILKRNNKIQSELALEKSVVRRRKKKKKISCSDAVNLQNQDVNDDEKTEIESNSKKTSENVESGGIINTSSDPRPFSNYPNLNHLHQHNSAMGYLPHMPSSVDPHYSNTCCSCFNCSASLNQNPNSGFPRLPGSCFGAPSFSPLLGAYPFNLPSPMYQQPMAPPWSPYPSPNFYTPPYGYYLPYFYNNASNGYINYYEAQYSRSVVESSSYAESNSNTPATAVSANTTTEAEKTDDENSNDGELVVDEGDPSEEEPPDGGTD